MTIKKRAKKCIHCGELFSERYGDSEAEWASRRYCGYLCLNRHKDHSWHPPIEERFWSRVDKRGENECWLWTGIRGRFGRGVFHLRGKQVNASRLALFVTTGKWPTENEVVRHSCDNPSCVNPKHLLVGTQADNVADMYARGRQNPPIGERNGRAKLTTEQVIAIREAFSHGEPKLRIAKRFSVNRWTVKNIVERTRWGHVP